MERESAGRVFRVLELYCGIGGVASVLGSLASVGGDPRPRVEVVGAIDINRLALEVYSHNFSHPAFARLVDAFSSDELARFEADLWWASPPCQPFTRRGRGRDLDDPRAATFLALLDRLATVRPRYFAMENVVGFEGSEARERLLRTLETAGYGAVREACFCPSEWGIPNRRPRYYLVASRVGELLPEEKGRGYGGVEEAGPRDLTPYLVGEEELIGRWGEGLWVEPGLVERYEGALHVVDAVSGLPTACFTSAYGRSHVRSGSYLRSAEGRLRRFAPEEILCLLGFAEGFGLPRGLRLGNAWRLVGNSLSLVAVARVLGWVPGLGGSSPTPHPTKGTLWSRAA